MHLYLLLAVIFAKELTLDNCISIAKANNPQLIQSQKAVEIAKTEVASARSAQYPSVSLSSGYNRSYTETDTNSSYSTRIGLSYSLFQGGYIWASIKISEIRLKIAEENYKLTEQEVILSVKQAFFNIFNKQEQVKLAGKIVSRRKADYLLIKLKYNAGGENYPAVEESETNQLQAEYDKISAEEGLKLSKTELNLLLGAPIKEEVALKYELQEVDFPSSDEMVAKAKTDRPDMRTERLNHEVLEKQSVQSKSDFFPELSVSSSYSLSGDELFTDEKLLGLNKSWGVGVSVSLPIFKGFSRVAKVKSSSLEILEHKVKLSELENKIEKEVLQAYSSWMLAKKKVEVSEKNLKASDDMYRLTKLQYEQGTTSYFMFQQKESALTSAEYNYISTLYNLQTAIANLYKVGGL